VNTHWYVIRKLDGTFWTGKRDDYSENLFNAKFFSKLEMEVSFVHKNEEWFPIHSKGDS
jgi:hypothetical protein